MLRLLLYVPRMSRLILSVLNLSVFHNLNILPNKCIFCDYAKIVGVFLMICMLNLIFPEVSNKYLHVFVFLNFLELNRTKKQKTAYERDVSRTLRTCTGLMDYVWMWRQVEACLLGVHGLDRYCSFRNFWVEVCIGYSAYHICECVSRDGIFKMQCGVSSCVASGFSTSPPVKCNLPLALPSWQPVTCNWLGSTALASLSVRLCSRWLLTIQPALQIRCLRFMCTFGSF